MWSVVRVMRARARREFCKISRDAVSFEGEFRKFLDFWFVSEGARARAASRAAPREFRYFLGISPREVVSLPERHM